jgi:hypothetical protein
MEKAYMSKLPNASAIGSLIYTMVCRRLDIVNAVGVVSRESSQADFEVSKRLIRHIPMLHRSRFNVDFDSRKSTTSLVQLCFGPQSCRNIIALSTTKAGYVAVIKARKEMVWL